jgi:hypothetical protein
MGTSRTKALWRAARGLASKLSRRAEGAASGHFAKDPIIRMGRRTQVQGSGSARELLSEVQKREPAHPHKGREVKKTDQLGKTAVPYLDRETGQPKESRVGSTVSNVASTMRALALVTEELHGSKDRVVSVPAPTVLAIPKPASARLLIPKVRPRLEVSAKTPKAKKVVAKKVATKKSKPKKLSTKKTATKKAVKKKTASKKATKKSATKKRTTKKPSSRK